jgi:hypothetical protein
MATAQKAIWFQSSREQLDAVLLEWNDPLNWHTHDGHTLRERKHEWREESDIPVSSSAWL